MFNINNENVTTFTLACDLYLVLYLLRCVGQEDRCVRITGRHFGLCAL